jgi:urease accessory protein UreG
MSKKITRVGIGGPVGSSKTAIVEAITPRLLDLGIKVLIITNDVVTTEDAKHVQRALKGVLLQERIPGVETGACPHTAVREDRDLVAGGDVYHVDEVATSAGENVSDLIKREFLFDIDPRAQRSA